ncbi:hypothetical protein [Synechococcus sp. BDU 130192]|uniref:beta strand repeat-containing protein n=1 Tax=Synechococcus sp. BDU 130192 TaxID=2042059 RepID=UPI000C07D831|nr:hypothetical protein [Synechococcus sp. BDU 130192]
MVIAGLMAAGQFQLIPQAIAATAAGTTIRNTATATYQDPNDPTNTPINTTSNTVEVTVAEIAGISISDGGVIDDNGGETLPGDLVYFDFIVTNTGNDTTTLFLPGRDNITITGPGSIEAADDVQVIGTIIDGVTTTLGTPVTVPTVGGFTGSEGFGEISGLEDGLTGSGESGTGSALKAGDSIIVRIPVTVNDLAASGADIRVLFGNTGLNDNTINTQNQPDDADGASNLDDVRTRDDDNVTGDAGGVPVNGEREASRFQETTVGAKPQAFATLGKTHVEPINTNSTPELDDDLITYNLTLDVEANPPAGATGFTAAALEPTSGINIDGTDRQVILVSDAIPAGTSLNAAPTAPAGWIVVYTDDDPATVNANDAEWETDVTNLDGGNATLDGVTRVGFVYDVDENLDNAATVANNVLATGSNVTGFSFTVITDGVTNGVVTNIANIAQVFGTTADGDGNPTNNANEVYDESGDQDPSNFNADGTPNANDDPDTPEREDITDGVGGGNGVDSGNDNTGVGPGGEDNVVTLAPPGTILNGPNGAPAAVGPNDNSDDFTNKSVVIAAGTAPGSNINPAPITFTNTIRNPGASPLNNVLLVPDTFEPTATDTGSDNFFDTIAATALSGPGNPGNGGGTTIVPFGTTVTISYNGNTAVYTYTDLAVDNFVFTSGTAIQIPTLAPGQSINYTVTVDLPTDTPLSTDTGLGFDVPIYAFVDTDNDSRPDQSDVDADTAFNRTINRVYTGYLRLVKEQRLLQSDGTTEIEGFTISNFSSAPQPGNIIEYRITYANVSVLPAGSSSVVLDAEQVVILEDGTTNTENTAGASPNGNNWAQGPSAPGAPGNAATNLFTSHVVGSVNNTFGTVTYIPAGEQTGTTQASDVTSYTNSIGVNITPGQSGIFSFQRKIN